MEKLIYRSITSILILWLGKRYKLVYGGNVVRTYAGQKIAKIWQGRAADHKNKIPSVLCWLLFSDDHHFYLLEENPDATYKEHLSLPLERIIDISTIQLSQNERMMGDAQNILAQSGVFVVKPPKNQKPQSYLMLTYYDNTLYQTYLCFPYIRGDMKKIVKYFQKIKKRYA